MIERYRGFTLVEVMLVVAIVDVLAALGTAGVSHVTSAAQEQKLVSDTLIETSTIGFNTSP